MAAGRRSRRPHRRALSAVDCFFRDRSLSRRLIRHRQALSGLDRSHLLVQEVMTDHDGVTNTVALALRQIEGVPRVAAVYIDERFEE